MASAPLRRRTSAGRVNAIGPSYGEWWNERPWIARARVAAVLLALAHRLRRSFCRILCPVGTCSELILKLERALEKRGVIYG